MNAITAQMDALAQRLARVESELTIRNLIVRYGMAADCGDAKTATACFTEDAEYRISAPRAGRDESDHQDLVLTGRAAIEAMLQSELHQSLLPFSAHTVGPATVIVGDTKARATGYSRLYHRSGITLDGAAPTLMRLAINEWQMVNIDGNWLIKSRESRLIGEHAAQILLRHAAYPY